MYYDGLKKRLKEKIQLAEAVNSTRQDILSCIAKAYIPLHQDIISNKHEEYNLPGGRGSCKSSFVSLEIVDGIMKNKEANAIIFRYVADTLRDSVFNQVQWAISELGADALWSYSVKPMIYTYKPTGQKIFFKGLDDSNKLKSIKPSKGYFKFIWFEEFSEFPGSNTIRSVRQSVMRGGKAFKIFNSFNPPISKANWANKHVLIDNPKAVTFRTTYKDVPAEWLGESFIEEAELLKTINPKAYQHEYMGEAVGSGGEVFPNLEIREITNEEIEQFEYIYVGLDFGFSVDPACVMRVAYNNKTRHIYLIDELYKKGLSNAKLAELIQEKGIDKKEIPEHLQSDRMRISGYETKCSVMCDCAEPKSISDLKALGIKAHACTKFPGCVLYRIKWLQSKTIVIDPARTPNALAEFSSYEYMTTKDGEFLAEVPDKNNHSIDAVAYALDRVINKSKNSA